MTTYNVYRDGAKIASGISEKTFNDTGLAPHSSHEYQVSAENDFGESPLSEAISVTTNYSSVSGVSLNKTTDGLEVSGTDTLVATVAPATADPGITWSSDNELVATVDASGLVTAVAAGTATITATSTVDGTKSATCALTVS
jgi:uncharacterized protein YjdB